MPTRLEQAHARTRQSISREASRLVRRAWVGTSSEGEFVDEAIEIANSARGAAVAEVDAFLASYLLVNGVSADVRGLDPDAFSRPVDPSEQWRRPHKHLRTKLVEGMAAPQALRFGQRMAETMMATDLQFASRGASREWMSQEPTIDGYRRLLSAAVENCGLCIAASDQLYYRDDLMPLHDNCHCSLAPFSTSRRYGLSEGQYEQVLEQTGGDTSRESLSRVRLNDPVPGSTEFRVFNHGELGPYLYDAGHSPPQLDVAA